jgi:hypothetical protein
LISSKPVCEKFIYSAAHTEIDPHWERHLPRSPPTVTA